MGRRKVPEETFTQRVSRINAEWAKERRDRYVKNTLDALAVLAALERADDALPLVEVEDRVCVDGRLNGLTWYERKHRVYTALRKLLAMGLVEQERRKYERVTRWVLTEHGSSYMDEVGCYGR